MFRTIPTDNDCVASDTATSITYLHTTIPRCGCDLTLQLHDHRRIDL